MPDRNPNLPSSAVQVLKGHAEIIERASFLEELALRCGQSAAMHWLEHFLAVPTFRGKTPYLVLSGEDDVQSVTWAVLMYEWTPLGLPTGIFSTDDISGFRTVIAPAEQLAAAASAAADAVLKLGAQVVVITCPKAARGEPLRLIRPVPCRWALGDREVCNTLPARATYEETLTSLGKGTRFNMRYYRRRLLRRMEVEFVPDARDMFTSDQLDALNKTALNPMPEDVIRLEYASACSVRGGFLVGLRTVDDRWLAVVGGWRQADTTVLLWQMNRAGFERASIGTVMRGYFLEHEIEHGARRIVFYGGTPNSIQHSFIPGSATDLIVVRRSWRASLLMRLTKIISKPHWWMKNANFLAATLHSDELVWRETGSGVGTVES